MSDQSPSSNFLDPMDAQTLDALVEGGFAPDVLGENPSPKDQRAQRIQGLLALLDTEPRSLREEGNTDMSQEERRSLLIDVTMARVLRDRREQATDEPDTAGLIDHREYSLSLSTRDEHRLETLVESGWTDAVGPEARPVARLLSLLDTPLTRPSGELVDSTLERIQGDIDAKNWRFRLDPEFAPVARSGGFRLADLVAVAAMLLIGTAILWPVLVASRANVYLEACRSNMQQAGLGFSLYAQDHDGRLPEVENQAAGALWWAVGDPTQSHSANLFLLTREGYVPIGALACPGNPFAPSGMEDPDAADWASHQQVSYSLQLYHQKGMRLDGGSQGVLLADRSPVVSRAMHNAWFSPDSCSRNHNGRGQHVLFTDMGVYFLARPYLASGDSLWLPGHAEGQNSPTLTGKERPASASDAFVGP